MLKQTITYEDFNGVMRTEDFFFNLTQAELLRMEVEVPGGLSAYIEGIGKAENTAAVVMWLTDFITWCYGQKSDDGRKFNKDPKETELFLTSEPFSQLVMDMLESEHAMANFFEGVVPQALLKRHREAVKQYGSEEALIKALNDEKRERRNQPNTDKENN